MNFHHRKLGRRPVNSLRQPDSLKLSCSLEVLKLLHKVAAEVESRYGDKAADKTYFLKGVQGKISRPALTSNPGDYTYFLAKVEEVRHHLGSYLVQSALSDLSQMALDIYNRFDNRSRMGVGVTVLSMLAGKRSPWFAVPGKYHPPTFVV